MFLKFICLCCVTAYIIAAPLKDEVSVERQHPTVIPIISLSAEYVADGKFKYNYETGNGIKREETAYDKESPEGKSHSDCSNEGGEDDDSGEIHVQKGSYSYTAPDGTLVSVRYIADENGFQPIITEVSHNGSQLSSDLSQNLRQSDNGKIAKDKTSDHPETEHGNDSNEQSTRLSKNNEPKRKDLEDKIPLKFGDKLKKSGKLIKEEPLMQNNSQDEEKVVNAETPNKESQNSTNNLIPDDKKDRYKTDSIIHEEPLSTAENSTDKIPSKIENKTTDKENKEYVPDKVEKKTKNATEKPSHNKDESKKNDKPSHQVKEMSDNKKPNTKIQESDKLKEDLASKEDASFKTENNNDKQINTTDKNKKANPEPEEKPLETEKNTTKVKSPEAVVKPQENEANSTNSKINTERKSDHKINIPEKQNKTSERTEAANIDGEQGSKNVLNISKNKNDDNNSHDLPDNIMDNTHETKNTSAKTEKKPSKSEIESPKNKNDLNSKDQLPEKKEIKASLENASSSHEAEKNLDNSQKNKTTQSFNADGIKDNKNDTSDSIKTKPNKENKELPKEKIKIANETNKLETKNKTLNYTDGMPEREIKKPHEYENVSAESKKEPVKSRIQSSENKKIKNEMTERNTDDNVKKTDKEEEKGNEDEMNNQNHKETPVNSLDNLANKNNSHGVPHNLEEKNSKLDKQMINNNNISNNKETNENMPKNLVGKKDKSPLKSISGQQTIPEEEAKSDKKQKIDKKNPSKEMEKSKTHPNKEENNILKKNETLKNGESDTNNTEKTASPTELLNGTLKKDILKEVQKPVKEAEKHEKVAEKAAEKAVKAAEVAENAADTAQKAAKDTEAILKTLNQTGNHSRELAISAAIKHAKIAGDAAKEAVKAAEMAEVAADNAKNAAQAAERVVELVQSSSNTKHLKELINKAGDAVQDAQKSANDAVHAAKDATKQSESLPKTELKNIDANLTSNI